MIVLRNGKRYEQILYRHEQDFERVAVVQLGTALPDFHVLKFKPHVLGDEGVRRRPDLALVHQRYLMWVVVEVELEHHSLEQHVFPQIRTFTTGSYGEEHAEALLKANSSLEKAAVLRMVQYRQPAVMVLVNSRAVFQRGWGDLSSELGAEVTTLEVYRSLTDTIFSLEGYLPKVAPRRVTGARKSPMLNGLECAPPPPVPFPRAFRMLYENRPTEWVSLTTGDRVVLLPRVPFEIDGSRNYEIVVSDDGQHVLRKL